MSDVLSRRAFVGKVAAGAAVAATAGIAAQAVSAREQLAPASGEGRPAQPYSAEPWAAPSAAQGTPPWELLQPLTAGAAVTPEWHVAELSGVLDGSCVLTLANARGRTQRIHLCGNAGRPHGLVHTERVDLLVMNGGQGDLPTEEGFAQAVAAVAHVIAANEFRAAVVGTLVPHAERLEQFAAAAQLR
jgi:hypothetical protein